MKNIELISLDNMLLKEINGGSQESYDAGYRFGEALRKTIMFFTLTHWMI